MDIAELLGGFAAGFALAIFEWLRHRKTRAHKTVVIEGVEHATRELEKTENKTPEAIKRDKCSADLVKIHIRSVAVKKKCEASLNIDVRKIQNVIEAIAEARTKPEPTDAGRTP